MTRTIFIIPTLLVCAGFAAAMDAAPEQLARLRLQHQVALFEARENLAAAFDEVLALAIKKDDDEGALAQLEGKQKFLKENLLPGDAALAPAVLEFATARRTADAAFTAESQKIVAAVLSAGDEKLAADLKQTASDYLKGHANQIAVAQARIQTANSVQARSTKICDSLSRIISAHDEIVERLTKVKSSLNTPNVSGALEEEAGKILKGQTWTLTCRITSIKPAFGGAKGRYELGIEPPLETASVAGEWHTSPMWRVALQREQAEKVTAGDWLEITATPVYLSKPSGTFSRYFQSKLQINLPAAVSMHNERTNVRHQTAK